MRIVLLMAIAVSLISCQPEDVDPANDLPVSCTLKLSKDFVPGIAFQTIQFRYIDINGNLQLKTNPTDGEVTDVDFSQYVKVTAVAGNYLDPDVLCSWNLKKDGVVIDVATVSNYTYENQ
jgi:hypothetical protein